MESTMSEFLSGEEIITAIKQCLRDSKQADFAVAYWGKGAIERLSLDKINMAVRILCDLRSLACNPYELEKLLRPPFELKSKDGLHAKVYITTNAVITGSANASINGLGDEGDESDLKLEAAIKCSEKQVLADAKKWFNKHWKEAECVKQDWLDQLKPEWRLRRRLFELLPMLVRAPDFFRHLPIRLVILEDCRDDEYKYVWSKVKKDKYTKEQRRKYEPDGHPFYIDHFSQWKIKPGDYLVSYWAKSRGQKTKAWELNDKAGGFWRLRGVVEIMGKNGKKLKVFFADSKSNAYGFRFSDADHKRLGSCVKDYFQKQCKAKKGVLMDVQLSELSKEILDSLRKSLAQKTTA
jgi:hypothetical protein